MGLPCSWARISSTHLSLSPNIYVMLPVPCTYSLWVFLNYLMYFLPSFGLQVCLLHKLSLIHSLGAWWYLHSICSNFLSFPVTICILPVLLWISSKVVVRLKSLGVVISATYVLGSLQYILASWMISKKFQYLLILNKTCLILSLDIYQTLLGNQFISNYWSQNFFVQMIRKTEIQKNVTCQTFYR